MSGAALASVTQEDPAEGFVTACVGGQLIGIRLGEVRDVFVPRGLCPVPLAPPAIAGVLNLRGRIVTAIDLRRRLGLAPAEAEASRIAIGIERGQELYGLIADRIGDVLRPSQESFEPIPVNLDACWSEVCSGIHRLDKGFMVILEIEGLLRLGGTDSAGA